jgi:hypothetical protein
MPAPQPILSTWARWIIRTRLAAVSPGRKHTPGIHTRATGFLPFTSPACGAHCDYHIGTSHLLPAPFRADDQTAAQALARLGAGESQVRNAITALQAESGPKCSA